MTTNTRDRNRTGLCFSLASLSDGVTDAEFNDAHAAAVADELACANRAATRAYTAWREAIGVDMQVNPPKGSYAAREDAGATYRRLAAIAARLQNDVDLGRVS